MRMSFVSLYYRIVDSGIYSDHFESYHSRYEKLYENQDFVIARAFTGVLLVKAANTLRERFWH